MTAAATKPSLQDIALDQLHESTHNPRQHFDPKGLEELAASIKEHGIITPLTVRANGKGYEIAAGHRRYRAAKLAGLIAVPAVVKELTDQQFLEILMIENLQREDVHPLEEAAGYHALMKLHKGWNATRIAERVGKSVKYVYDRVKLLSLTKEAQKLFIAGTLTAGHAIILARLSAADQERALIPEDPELWHAEHLLYDPKGDREDDNPYAGLKLASVRELQAWVDKHVRFEIAAPPDPLLFPETHDTLQEVMGEGEKLVAITHNIITPDDVKDGGPRPILGKSWKRADGQEDSKECEYAVMGVIVIGRGRGEAFKVCTRKDKCKVHWAALVKAREKREKVAASGKPVASVNQRVREESQREQDRYRREQEQKDAAVRRWEKAAPAILAAVVARINAMPTKANGFLAQIILDEMRVGQPKTLLIQRGTHAEDFIRHAAYLALANKIRNSWLAPQSFPKVAKAMSLDLQKILDQAAPVEKPKQDCTVCEEKGIDPTKHVCSPPALKKARAKGKKDAPAKASKKARRQTA